MMAGTAKKSSQRLEGPVMAGAAILVEHGMGHRDAIRLVDTAVGRQPSPGDKGKGSGQCQPLHDVFDAPPPRPLDIVQLNGLLQLFRIVQHPAQTLLFSPDKNLQLSICNCQLSILESAMITNIAN